MTQTSGSSPLHRTDSTSASAQAWSSSPVHVVVVDDAEPIREILRELLTEEGFLVSQAGDAQGALQLIRAGVVHVILVDVRLPDMNGIDLVDMILRERPSTSAIVMTGHGSIDLAVKAMKAGAVDFLTKPFDTDVVLLTVRRVVELQRLRQENSVLKSEILKAGGIRLMAFQQEEIDPDSLGQDKRGVSTSMAERRAYERGLAEGERRFREREGAQRDREHALLKTVMKKLEETVAHLRATLDDEVAGLAFMIACKVIRECADTNQEVVKAQVREALGRVKDCAQAHIRVNPKDLPILEAAKAEFAQVFEGPVSIFLDPDPTVSVGGCVVHTGTRLIDATIEAQLLRLGEGFRKKRAR